MGISDKEMVVVDCSVGTIVWVRRRNGSWWPGKIVGPEELSAAHLMSPRSGTPVQLLGREDASVDWYNLEKSKRVKPFRCSEFEDCIERAESSQGMPPKKREKYARREDAILHALEIEKQLMEKTNDKLSSSSNCKSSKSSDSVEKELATALECSGNDNGKHEHAKSCSKKLDMSLEDKSTDGPLYVQNAKEASQQTQNNYEEPRIRGLQKSGLAYSRRKVSSSVALNGSCEPEKDDNALALSSGGLSTENLIHANSESSLDQRRKYHELLTDESLVRRRDKRRPLVQVLQSSAKLPVHPLLQGNNDTVSIQMSGDDQKGAIDRAKRSSCIYFPGESGDCSDDKKIGSSQIVVSPSQLEVSDCPHPATLGEENDSESTEDTETDSSETDSLDSDADVEMVEFSDALVVTELEPKSLGRSGAQVQQGSMSSMEPYELPLANDVSHLCHRDPVLASTEVSKWKLKGKRNNRGLAKRSIDVAHQRVFRGSMYGTNLEERETNGHDDPDLTEKKFRTEKRAFDNSGFEDITNSINDWEDLAWNDQRVLKGYWEDSSNYFNPLFVGRNRFGGRTKSNLVDVDLKVQSSYQREHVPMISLMSKLNGQAIVGHPVQIEVLENGSSEIILSATNDHGTALPPTWKTARRSANFRVPRSHPSATLDVEEPEERFQYADQDKNILFKKSSLGNSGRKARTMRKSISQPSRPTFVRKFSRKQQKKVSLSTGQKIKALSSIGTKQKLRNESENGIGNYQVDGLIKGESGPTTVACIPVKLVFSRLYEELVGRHQ